MENCECGHELAAHEINNGNTEEAPCSGCKQQYGYGGCRAGGFQNGDTRQEHLIKSGQAEMQSA
jgi:hypothetical protein